MESKGRRIHGQAAQKREASQHLEALKLYPEALLAYQRDNDVVGFSETFADMAIVYRHLFDETGDKKFLITAKNQLINAVEIAENSGNKQALAIPYLQLANVQRDLGQLQEAISSYQKAVANQTNNPAPEHNRPAVLADMKAHLATCGYRLGDKSALDRAQEALEEIEQTDEDKYNKDVWLSGTHMRIAEMLRGDDPQKAKEHLQQAKEIIDANPDLKLRKEQWEKLAETFN